MERIVNGKVYFVKTNTLGENLERFNIRRIVTKRPIGKKYYRKKLKTYDEKINKKEPDLVIPVGVNKTEYRHRNDKSGSIYWSWKFSKLSNYLRDPNKKARAIVVLRRINSYLSRNDFSEGTKSYIKASIEKIRKENPDITLSGFIGNSFIDYSFGNYDDEELNAFLEKSIFKKIGKKIKKGVKSFVKKPLKSVLKVGAITGAVFFGAPALASGVTALGTGASAILGKIASSPAGMWWVNTGGKLLRVFKTKKGKVITQQVPANSIPNMDQLPQNVPITESQFKTLTQTQVPMTLPSGLDTDEVSILKSKGIEYKGLETEYNEGEGAKFEIKGNQIKEEKLSIGSMLLPAGVLLAGMMLVKGGSHGKPRR